MRRGRALLIAARAHAFTSGARLNLKIPHVPVTGERGEVANGEVP